MRHSDEGTLISFGEGTEGGALFQAFDFCPHDPAKRAPLQCGCGASEEDTDGDGYADCIDECPQNAFVVLSDPVCGCSSEGLMGWQFASFVWNEGEGRWDGGGWRLC